MIRSLLYLSAALLALRPAALRAQCPDTTPAASDHAVAFAVRAFPVTDPVPRAASIGETLRMAAGDDAPYASPKKSPVLAGLMSLVVPGAGEVYAESYWLAAPFVAIEGAGWYFNISQNKKGDDQTSYFQSYADTHWSLVKYAEWLNANAKSFPGGENTTPITIDPNTSLPPWERVNWDELHAVETAVPVFSHRLPPHGDQQYYELIGKYNQYSYGWDDKTTGPYDEISSNFNAYSHMRGKANDYYTTAETILNIVILNHVLSAVDAAWAAARFNHAVSLHSEVRPIVLPDGSTELSPSVAIHMRF